MHYNIDDMMDLYDKWDDAERRHRFLRRMQHKLNIKEQRVRRQTEPL